ncbi:MAG: hypothetical protein AAFO86_11125 [Pseudomonadota bacterium]
MTRLCYDGTRWSSNQNIFTSMVQTYGNAATYHGIQFGGTGAYGFLGPDITRSGGATNHTASATGPGWNQAWTEGMGGPDVTFTEDTTHDWVRGHLLNGEWGGSGSNWANLIAMTAGANANHKTVEGHVRKWLNKFRTFDDTASGHTTYWYGIRYWVQASTSPFSEDNDGDDLYSYCPNMIRVTWRIVRIAKPVGVAGTSAGSAVTATAAGLRAITPANFVAATAAQIEGNITSRPTKPGAILPNTEENRASAAADSAVRALSNGIPAIPVAGSTYDGSVQVYQS